MAQFELEQGIWREKKATRQPQVAQVALMGIPMCDALAGLEVTPPVATLPAVRDRYSVRGLIVKPPTTRRCLILA